MTELTANYANALYTLAREESILELINTQAQGVSRIFQDNPGYTAMLNTPTLDVTQKLALIDEAFGEGIHVYLLNFLKLLTEKRLADIFVECAQIIGERYDEEHGIEHVTAITASALTDTLKRKLIEKAEKITGKTIFLENRVDPSCMGGVILQFSDKQIDGSVKTKLEEMRKQISSVIA